MLLALCACGARGGDTAREENAQDAPNVSFDSLQWEESGELVYADRFSIEKSGEYELLTIVDSGRFLLVSGEAEIPSKLPEDVTVLHTPVEKSYLAASSAFDLIGELGCLDRVRFSGTKESDLVAEEALNALKSGDMLYAGKYSAPDYELLVDEGCDLAIESTMIYHDPETKEKLEALGIPVLVERSSYESHPLGRLEWIKFYGALYGEEERANVFFDQQVRVLAPIMNLEKTECSAAFFYINTNGAVNVRKPGDYIASLISLAGGTYVPAASAEEEENALSTMNMQMEDFYLAARDADILIYNGNITGVLGSVQDLLDKNALFRDFRAVKEGHVFCTGKNFFQQTTALGELMEDLGRVLRDPDAEDLKQLIRLQ